MIDLQIAEDSQDRPGYRLQATGRRGVLKANTSRNKILLISYVLTAANN